MDDDCRKKAIKKYNGENIIPYLTYPSIHEAWYKTLDILRLLQACEILCVKFLHQGLLYTVLCQSINPIVEQNKKKLTMTKFYSFQMNEKNFVITVITLMMMYDKNIKKKEERVSLHSNTPKFIKKEDLCPSPLFNKIIYSNTVFENGGYKYEQISEKKNR